MEVNNIITVPSANFDIDPRGMGRVYYDCMIKNQNKIALVEGLTGNTVTYKKLLQRSIRTAIALKNDKLEAGDVIVIYCYNHIDSTTIVLGGLFVNAIVVGINEKSPLEHVIEILNQVKPKVVFVAQGTLQTLTEAIDHLSLFPKIVLIDCENPNYVFFEKYLHGSVEEEEKTFEPTSAENMYDTAMVFFTSGTTGTPKGVCRSHFSLLYCHYNIMGRNFCWDTFLEFSTPAWTVHMNFLSICILLGTRRVIYQTFSPDYAWQFLRHKVTCMFLGVWEILHMCKYNRPKSSDASSLKTIITGGTVMSQNKMHIIKEVFTGVHICNTYGQTETGAMFLPTPTDAKNFERTLTSSECVGSGLPGISYKIADFNNEQTLGPNQKGELRVKTVYPLGSYYKIDTSFMYDEDGWFKTGDLAYYDEDRCFFIVGRIGETFKFRNFVIVPSLIEDVLMKHPAVEKALVTGVPHDTDGEHPIALVTLREGFETVTANKIEQFVSAQVFDCQRLRAGVRILDEFVMTATGKIDKNVARKSLRIM